jgi:hypothetical protein
LVIAPSMSDLGKMRSLLMSKKEAGDPQISRR